jgi:hypothetical protein
VLTSYTADRLPSAEMVRPSIADVTVADLEALVAGGAPA